MKRVGFFGDGAEMRPSCSRWTRRSRRTARQGLSTHLPPPLSLDPSSAPVGKSRRTPLFLSNAPPRPTTPAAYPFNQAIYEPGLHTRSGGRAAILYFCKNIIASAAAHTQHSISTDTSRTNPFAPAATGPAQAPAPQRPMRQCSLSTEDTGRGRGLFSHIMANTASIPAQTQPQCRARPRPTSSSMSDRPLATPTTRIPQQHRRFQPDLPEKRKGTTSARRGARHWSEAGTANE